MNRIQSTASYGGWILGHRPSNDPEWLIMRTPNSDLSCGVIHLEGLEI